MKKFRTTAIRSGIAPSTSAIRVRTRPLSILPRQSRAGWRSCPVLRGSSSRILSRIAFPRALRYSQRPIHDPPLQRVGRHVVLQVLDPAADRDSGLMHRLRIAGDERMPPVQVLALGDQAVAAGRRQPADLRDRLRGEPDAIVDPFGAMPVVPAVARPGVEQAAAYVGEIDVFGLLLLELDEAAAAAAVAEAFPLGLIQVLQALCPPKWNFVDHVSPRRARLPRCSHFPQDSVAGASSQLRR